MRSNYAMQTQAHAHVGLLTHVSVLTNQFHRLRVFVHTDQCSALCAQQLHDLHDPATFRSPY